MYALMDNTIWTFITDLPVALFLTIQTILHSVFFISLFFLNKYEIWFSSPVIYNSFIFPNWITLIMRKNIKQKIYIFCWFFFLHFALFVWFYVNLFFFSNFFYLFHFKRILYSMLFTYIVFNASSKRIHITAFWRVSTANIPGHGFVILDEIKLYFLWFFNAPFNP